MPNNVNKSTANVMDTDHLKVTRELNLPISIDQVWNFLLDEEKMKNWLAARKFTIRISDGGEIEIPILFGDEKYLILGEITILLKQDTYALTWYERDPDGYEWFNCTVVTLFLKKHKQGTSVKLVHSGFKYLPPEIQENVHQRYMEYWNNSGILERFQTLVMAEDNQGPAATNDQE